MSVEETDALKRIKSKAAEKKAYSSIYLEAKALVQQEDMDEFEMYFESIKSQFVELEKRYKYAVKHKKKDAKMLGIQFDRIMIYYKAAMNVKFDLEEWKKENEAEMETEIPEKESLEIKTTMEYLVQKKDVKQIKTTLQTSYDTMSKAGTAHEKEPENEELTEKYQIAKTKYKLNKKFYTEAVNPTEEEDEEDIEAEASGNMAGGVSKFMELTEEKRTLFMGWKTLITNFLRSKGQNISVTEFTPLSYKQQVVAGMNYTIIIRFSTTITYQFTVYQKLDGNVEIKNSEEKVAGYTGLPKKKIQVKSAWSREFKPITKVELKKFTAPIWKVTIMNYFKLNKALDFNFAKFRPISFRKRYDKGTKWDVVYEIEEGKKINAQIAENDDGTMKVEGGEQKDKTFTGIETWKGFRMVDEKITTQVKDWRIMIQTWWRNKGMRRVFTRWEPISFKQNIDKDKDGKITTTTDVVVKVAEDATIKTTVIKKPDGKEETESAEEKPIEFTGIEEDNEEETVEPDAGFKQIDYKTRTTVMKWRTMIQNWWKTKGSRRTFKRWEPISFKSKKEFGKTTTEVVVKVDDDATIKTKVIKKQDGTEEPLEVEEKPVDFTGTKEDD
jgi:hypothetical protein